MPGPANTGLYRTLLRKRLPSHCHVTLMTYIASRLSGQPFNPLLYLIPKFLCNFTSLAVSGKRRVHLHKVTSHSPCTDLGPEEMLDVPKDRVEKLFKRFWGLSPDDDLNNSCEVAAPEYGHLVEVRNPLLCDGVFETITGPFKNVDIRTLHGQIPLSKPERKLLLRYNSGRRGRLQTLTRLFRKSEEDVRQTSLHSLGDRAKRYKKKKPKKQTSTEIRTTVVDDDIGNLISKFGEAAVGEEDDGLLNIAKSVNTMVDKWKEQETEKKVMMYESDSDSSLLTTVDKSKRVQGLVSNKQEERRSCWRKLCCCCCNKDMNVESVNQPNQRSLRIKRQLSDGKASEKLRQPHRRKVIHTDKLTHTSALQVPGTVRDLNIAT